jgi:hypothetical protein
LFQTNHNIPADLLSQIQHPSLRVQGFGADRVFRDDVLRYSLSGFSVEALENHVGPG